MSGGLSQACRQGQELRDIADRIDAAKNYTCGELSEVIGIAQPTLRKWRAEGAREQRQIGPNWFRMPDSSRVYYSGKSVVNWLLAEAERRDAIARRA